MRQREMVVGGVIQAVGGFVTDLRQLGGGEMLSDAGAHRAIERQAGAVDHVRERDLLLRRRHFDMGGVIVLQHRQLFGQIVAEQLRPGHGGAVAAGMGEAAEGAGFARAGLLPVPADAQFGIHEQPGGARLRIRQRAVADKVADRLTQRVYRGVIQGFQLIECLIGAEAAARWGIAHTFSLDVPALWRGCGVLPSQVSRRRA